MYSTIDNWLFTGTHAYRDVARIDFYHTDEEACLYLEYGDRKVVLDPEESRLVRRWNEIALQAAVADNEDFLLRRRCDVLEQQRRAEKMNRAPKRKSRTARTTTPENKIHRIK